MKSSAISSRLWAHLVLWIFFLLGISFVVILPLYNAGNWCFPGDLGDGRFNNYVLEQFYLWLIGKAPSFWNAGFFYPFPDVSAFSDNHFGNTFFYAFFRMLGANRETAFTEWYVVGYCLNFAAAAYVLRRFGFSAVGSGLGAFFFTFGLPMLSQETHVQLLYRWCVPFASYYCYRFIDSLKLKYLFMTLLFLTIQYYNAVYTGNFLLLFLLAFLMASPFFLGSPQFSGNRLLWLPRAIQYSWQKLTIRQQCFFAIGLFFILIAGLSLFWHYLEAARLYHLGRRWEEIASSLPTLFSYFYSPQSNIWSFSSNWPLSSVEESLFPGLAILLLIIIGIWKWDSLLPKQSQIAKLHIIAVLILMILTYRITDTDISLYFLVYKLPLINAMRAISRIQLINMWGLAIFAAAGFDALIAARKSRLLKISISLFFSLLLIFECSARTHIKTPYAEAQARITNMRKLLPEQLPQNSIILAASYTTSDYPIDIDAMILAQENGWQTLNGYSGNFPPSIPAGYISDCKEASERIHAYLDWAKDTPTQDYTALMNRVVPIGFTHCP